MPFSPLPGTVHRTPTDFANAGCRILMRDGVPLVDKLPDLKPPRELTAAQKHVERAFDSDGHLYNERKPENIHRAEIAKRRYRRKKVGLTPT